MDLPICAMSQAVVLLRVFECLVEKEMNVENARWAKGTTGLRTRLTRRALMRNLMTPHHPPDAPLRPPYSCTVTTPSPKQLNLTVDPLFSAAAKILVLDSYNMRF